MYSVEVSSAGDYLFRVKANDYEFEVDAKGRGATPPDTLLASLGSCVGVYIRKYAEGARLAIDEFTVKVSGELCKEAPARFKTIDVSVGLRGSALDERRRKALIEFIKNCPVHNTLRSDPEIKIRIE
ncbi:MAG: OsmC family protein [Candidatus Omnitrophota bacterium]